MLKWDLLRYCFILENLYDLGEPNFGESYFGESYFGEFYVFLKLSLTSFFVTFNALSIK